MEKFVYHLAGKNSTLAIDYDDIVGELFVELVKGVQAYPDLPPEQLKKVLMRMMDNRISELKYRYHVTHRRFAQYDISLSLEVSVSDVSRLGAGTISDGDAMPVEELIIGGEDPAELYDSKERVLSVRNRLTAVEQKVFDALINGNGMLAILVWLSSQRSNAVFGSRAAKMRPWHLADALHITEKEARQAIRKIKHVTREVLNDNR
jgi:hypothetical protein